MCVTKVEAKVETSYENVLWESVATFNYVQLFIVHIYIHINMAQIPYIVVLPPNQKASSSSTVNPLYIRSVGESPLSVLYIQRSDNI